MNSISKSELDLSPISWLGMHHQYLNEGEMEVIAALVAEAKVMVELGCRDGRTAKVLLHNVPSLRYYVGVDVTPDYVPGLSHQRAEMYSHPGWLAAGDSRFEVLIREHGSLDLGPGDLGPCDAVFIDGDHSERVVDHDSHLAKSIVRPGGVIIWHDAFNGAVEVTRVLDRLCDEGWPIKSVEGTWLAFMRT